MWRDQQPAAHAARDQQRGSRRSGSRAGPVRPAPTAPLPASIAAGASQASTEVVRRAPRSSSVAGPGRSHGDRLRLSASPGAVNHAMLDERLTAAPSVAGPAEGGAGRRTGGERPGRAAGASVLGGRPPVSRCRRRSTARARAPAPGACARCRSTASAGRRRG